MEVQEFALTWRTFAIIIAVSLIFIFPKTRTFYFKLFDFSALKRLDTYVVILLTLLFIFFSNLYFFNRTLSSTYNLLTSPYSRTLLLDKYELALFIISMTILMPVIEEMVFRAPLSLWENRLPIYFISLLISSLLFGLGHTEYPLFGVVLGISFGLVFRLSRSLMPAILTHMLWNVFSLFYFNYV